MEINGENINIEDLFNEKYMHKEVKKGIFLSDNQLEILKMNDIDIDQISSIDELIYILDEILDDDPDNIDLENVLNEIVEYNYYANTNK
jgi:hypothetical protein